MLTQTATVEHRSATSVDAYGNEVATTVSTTAVSAYVEQTAATEVIVDRETYVTDWLVVLPAGTVIDASDQILYGAHTLKVVGPPARPWSPRTRAEHHVECRCVEVVG